MNETQVVVTRILAIIAERRSWYSEEMFPDPDEKNADRESAFMARHTLDCLENDIREEFDLNPTVGPSAAEIKSAFMSKKDSCI